MTLKNVAPLNITENGENVGNHHFLLFPQCFLSIHEQLSALWLFDLLFLHAFNLGQSQTFLV